MTAAVAGGYLIRLVLFILFLMFLIEYMDAFIDWLFSILTFTNPIRRRTK